MMLANIDLLTYTIPANEVIDFFRIITAFVGAVHFTFAVVRFLDHKVFWAGIAFMATGLLTVLQQVEAIGMPLVPWRLPLYLLMNVAGIIYLYRIGTTKQESPR